MLLLWLLMLLKCCVMHAAPPGVVLSVKHMPYPEWTYCHNMLGVKFARVEVPYAEWTQVNMTAKSGGYRRYDNCQCRPQMLIANADSDTDSYAC